MRVRKVLHVIPSVGLRRGGPSTMLRQLASGLAQAGVETHVAATDDDGDGRLEVDCGRPVVQNGVTYWFFPRQVRLYTVSWPLNRWLARRISDFDLVHIHALFSFSSTVASYWARRRAIPYVVRPLGTLNRWGMANCRPLLKQGSFQLLERQILAHAALVHYTSELERHEANALSIRTRSAVIPNPVAMSSLGRCASSDRQRSKLAGRQVILFLSRIDRKKGLDLLLRAFAVIRERFHDAVLVIAGEGNPEFVRSLQADAVAMGIQDDIVWIGFVSGDVKQTALADADVFVLPSYSENFGIAVAEAMAAGVPVVVSNQVGIHQEVADASAGLVVPCDAAQLADAIMTLLADGARRAAMGESAAVLAKRYAPEVVAAQLVDMYNDVVSVSSGGRGVWQECPWNS